MRLGRPSVRHLRLGKGNRLPQRPGLPFILILGLLALPAPGRCGDDPPLDRCEYAPVNRTVDAYYRWDLVLRETWEDGKALQEVQRVRTGYAGAVRKELEEAHRKRLQGREKLPRAERGAKPAEPTVAVIASRLDVQDAERRLAFLRILMEGDAVQEQKAIHLAADQIPALEQPERIARAARGRWLRFCIRRVRAFAEAKPFGVPVDPQKALHLDVSIAVSNPTQQPRVFSLKEAYISRVEGELGERTGAFEPVWGGAGRREVPPGGSTVLVLSAPGVFRIEERESTFYVTLVLETGKKGEERERSIVRASTLLGKPAKAPAPR